MKLINKSSTHHILGALELTAAPGQVVEVPDSKWQGSAEQAGLKDHPLVQKLIAEGSLAVVEEKEEKKAPAPKAKAKEKEAKAE